MRKAPAADTYKLLYSRSGNECAFPQCNHPIFNDEGTYVAQLCHIRAANEGGPRYDKEQSNEQRRASENLLFMCYRHHVETDDVEKYSVSELENIKSTHESQFTETGKKITNEMLEQINNESKYYWNRQKEKDFDINDLKMTTNFDFDELDLFNELLKAIDLIYNYCETCAISDDPLTLENDLKYLLGKAELDYSKIEDIPYFENPFALRNWEYHNIGLPNLFSNLKMKLYQLRIKSFENIALLNPKNKVLKRQLALFREEFEELYDNLYHVD